MSAEVELRMLESCEVVRVLAMARLTRVRLVTRIA